MRRQIICLALVVSAVVGITLYVRPVSAAGDVILTGTVTSATGDKMEGVIVTARAEGQSFTTSVFTDDTGSFYFPPLKEGKYAVWAQTAGYDRSRSDVSLSGAARKQDFALKPTKDVIKQLSGDQWIASLPADTPQDKRMKEIFRVSCNGCHQPSFVLQNRFDAAGWEKIITTMSQMSTSDVGTRVGPVFEHYNKELAAYLGKVRGPESNIQPKLRPRPKGEATLAVVSEYDIPGSVTYDRPLNDGTDWSLATPSGSGHRGVHDADFDLFGNIWFTNSVDNTYRTVGKVNMETGKVTEFKIPGRRGFAAGSHGITRDPDGNMYFNVSNVVDNPWVGNYGILGRVDPKTDKLETFTPPQEYGPVGGFLDSDLQGNIWTSTKAGALRFDPKTKTFQLFKYVSPIKPDGGTGGPYGVTVDAEGNGWWSEFAEDIVGKGVVSTGKSEELRLPPPPRAESVLPLFREEDKDFYGKVGGFGLVAGVPWQNGPRRPGTDKHGDTVWIPGWFGQSLLKIDIHTKQVKAYPVPTLDSGPYMTKIDKDHMVWLNFQNSDTVAKFDPKTEKWVEYSLPTLGGETHQIGILDRNGPTQVSLAYFRTSKVARLQFRTRQDVEALKKRAQDALSLRAENR